MTTLDAPPLDLLREHVAEVADRLEAVLAAIEAARTARSKVESAQDPVVGGPVSKGSAIREALLVDVRAVAEGKRPTAYAEVVNGRAALEGEALACEGFAAELVPAWISRDRRDVGRARGRYPRGAPVQPDRIRLLYLRLGVAVSASGGGAGTTPRSAAQRREVRRRERRLI